MSGLRSGMQLRQRLTCDFSGCCKTFRTPEKKNDHVFQDHKMIVLCTPLKLKPSQLKDDDDDDNSSVDLDESGDTSMRLCETPVKPQSKCSKCGKRLLERSMARHEAICMHGAGTTFSCDDGCGATFKTPRGKQGHYDRVHAPMVPCLDKNCQVRVRPVQMRQHIKKNHSRARAECENCRADMPLYAYPAHKRICDVLEEKKRTKKSQRETKKKRKSKLDINCNLEVAEETEEVKMETTCLVQEDYEFACVLDYCTAKFHTEQEKYIHEFDEHCSIVYPTSNMPLLDDSFEEEFLKFQGIEPEVDSQDFEYLGPEYTQILQQTPQTEMKEIVLDPGVSEFTDWQLVTPQDAFNSVYQPSGNYQIVYVATTDENGLTHLEAIDNAIIMNCDQQTDYFQML